MAGSSASPAASQGMFLEYAAEALYYSAFGLRPAEEASPREAGLLFYIAAAAKRHRRGGGSFARYSRIANEAARFKPAHAWAEGSLSPRSSFVGLSRHTAKHVIEFGVASRLRLSRDRGSEDPSDTLELPPRAQF